MKILVMMIVIVAIEYAIIRSKRRRPKEAYKQKPKDEDWVKAHYYALKRMAIDKGYTITKEDAEGVTFEAKHTKETCAKYQNSIDESIGLEWHNKCIMVPKAINRICKDTDAKLIYNVDNGTCRTTCDYCRTKSSEWASDTKDCYLPPSKRIMTVLFGNSLGKILSESSLDTTISKLVNNAGCDENQKYVTGVRANNLKWWRQTINAASTTP